MPLARRFRPTRRTFLLGLVSLVGLPAACAVQIPAPETAKRSSGETPTVNPGLTPSPAAVASAPTLAPTSTPQPQTTLIPQSMTPTLEIVQPAEPDSASFTEYAFEMRRLALESGDQAYGAIIVKDNRVVGLGPSRVVVNRDATCHAEMEAIRDASRRLGSADLSGCVMYSTSRPCQMCETASYWAHIERMYYGSNAADAGPPQYCAC